MQSLQFTGAFKEYTENESVQPPEGPVNIYKFNHPNGEQGGWKVRSIVCLDSRDKRRP